MALSQTVYVQLAYRIQYTSRMGRSTLDSLHSMDRPVKDKYHYTVPWLGITGGVMAFTKSQYEAVNGFSNEYWGWGCEDDDMFVRIVDSCLHLEQGESSLIPKWPISKW